MVGNFGNNLEAATAELNRLKRLNSNCNTNNSCPFVVYIDRDLRIKKRPFPNVRATFFGEEVRFKKYYTAQLTSISQASYTNEEDLKSQFLEKYSKYITDRNNLTVIKSGDLYELHYGKFLSYDQAKAMANKIDSYYSALSPFVSEIPAE